MSGDSTEQQTSQTPETIRRSGSVILLKQTLVLVLCVLATYALVYGAGYRTWFESVVLANLRMILRYPRLTCEQKNEMKHGFDYVYLRYVKDHTPPDAVILMPPDSVFGGSDFRDGAASVRSLPWSTYFLYPRRLLKDGESDPSQYGQATHVMIVEGWGYDRAEGAGSLADKPKYGVLPLAGLTDTLRQN